MGKISWGRLFRRGVAVCLATLALWALLLSAGAGAVAGELRRLSSSERFVTAVLRAELGDFPSGSGWRWDNPRCWRPIRAEKRKSRPRRHPFLWPSPPPTTTM